LEFVAGRPEFPFRHSHTGYDFCDIHRRAKDSDARWTATNQFSAAGHAAPRSMVRASLLYVATMPRRICQGNLIAVPAPEVRDGSTLKTWIFRILTNQAKTRGKRAAQYSLFLLKKLRAM
jgi:hypothetical protein